MPVYPIHSIYHHPHTANSSADYCIICGGDDLLDNPPRHNSRTQHRLLHCSCCDTAYHRQCIPEPELSTPQILAQAGKQAYFVNSLEISAYFNLSIEPHLTHPSHRSHTQPVSAWCCPACTWVNNTLQLINISFFHPINLSTKQSILSSPHTDLYSAPNTLTHSPINPSHANASSNRFPTPNPSTTLDTSTFYLDHPPVFIDQTLQPLNFTTHLAEITPIDQIPPNSNQPPATNAHTTLVLPFSPPFTQILREFYHTPSTSTFYATLLQFRHDFNTALYLHGFFSIPNSNTTIPDPTAPQTQIGSIPPSSSPFSTILTTSEFSTPTSIASRKPPIFFKPLHPYPSIENLLLQLRQIKLNPPVLARSTTCNPIPNTSNPTPIQEDAKKPLNPRHCQACHPFPITTPPQHRHPNEHPTELQFKSKSKPLTRFIQSQQVLVTCTTCPITVHKHCIEPGIGSLCFTQGSQRADRNRPSNEQFQCLRCRLGIYRTIRSMRPLLGNYFSTSSNLDNNDDSTTLSSTHTSTLPHPAQLYPSQFHHHRSPSPTPTCRVCRVHNEPLFTCSSCPNAFHATCLGSTTQEFLNRFTRGSNTMSNNNHHKTAALYHLPKWSCPECVSKHQLTFPSRTDLLLESVGDSIANSRTQRDEHQSEGKALFANIHKNRSQLHRLWTSSDNTLRAFVPESNLEENDLNDERKTENDQRRKTRENKHNNQGDNDSCYLCQSFETYSHYQMVQDNEVKLTGDVKVMLKDAVREAKKSAKDDKSMKKAANRAIVADDNKNSSPCKDIDEMNERQDQIQMKATSIQLEVTPSHNQLSSSHHTHLSTHPPEHRSHHHYFTRFHHNPSTFAPLSQIPNRFSPLLRLIQQYADPTSSTNNSMCNSHQLHPDSISQSTTQFSTTALHAQDLSRLLSLGIGLSPALIYRFLIAIIGSESPTGTSTFSSSTASYGRLVCSNPQCARAFHSTCLHATLTSNATRSSTNTFPLSSPTATPFSCPFCTSQLTHSSFADLLKTLFTCSIAIRDVSSNPSVATAILPHIRYTLTYSHLFTPIELIFPQHNLEKSSSLSSSSSSSSSSSKRSLLQSDHPHPHSSKHSTTTTESTNTTTTNNNKNNENEKNDSQVKKRKAGGVNLQLDSDSDDQPPLMQSSILSTSSQLQPLRSTSMTVAKTIPSSNPTSSLFGALTFHTNVSTTATASAASNSTIEPLPSDQESRLIISNMTSNASQSQPPSTIISLTTRNNSTSMTQHIPPHYPPDLTMRFMQLQQLHHHNLITSATITQLFTTPLNQFVKNTPSSSLASLFHSTSPINIFAYIANPHGITQYMLKVKIIQEIRRTSTTPFFPPNLPLAGLSSSTSSHNHTLHPPPSSNLLHSQQGTPSNPFSHSNPSSSSKTIKPETTWVSYEDLQSHTPITHQCALCSPASIHFHPSAGVDDIFSSQLNDDLQHQLKLHELLMQTIPTALPIHNQASSGNPSLSSQNPKTPTTHSAPTSTQPADSVWMQDGRQQIDDNVDPYHLFKSYHFIAKLCGLFDQLQHSSQINATPATSTTATTATPTTKPPSSLPTPQSQSLNKHPSGIPNRTYSQLQTFVRAFNWFQTNSSSTLSSIPSSSLTSSSFPPPSMLRQYTKRVGKTGWIYLQSLIRQFLALELKRIELIHTLEMNSLRLQRLRRQEDKRGLMGDGGDGGDGLNQSAEHDPTVVNHELIKWLIKRDLDEHHKNKRDYDKKVWSRNKQKQTAKRQALRDAQEQKQGAGEQAPLGAVMNMDDGQSVGELNNAVTSSNDPTRICADSLTRARTEIIVNGKLASSQRTHQNTQIPGQLDQDVNDDVQSQMNDTNSINPRNSTTTDVDTPHDEQNNPQLKKLPFTIPKSFQHILRPTQSESIQDSQITDRPLDGRADLPRQGEELDALDRSEIPHPKPSSKPKLEITPSQLLSKERDIVTHTLRLVISDLFSLGKAINAFSFFLSDLLVSDALNPRSLPTSGSVAAQSQASGIAGMTGEANSGNTDPAASFLGQVDQLVDGVMGKVFGDGHANAVRSESANNSTQQNGDKTQHKLMRSQLDALLKNIPLSKLLSKEERSKYVSDQLEKNKDGSVFARKGFVDLHIDAEADTEASAEIRSSTAISGLTPYQLNTAMAPGYLHFTAEITTESISELLETSSHIPPTTTDADTLIGPLFVKIKHGGVGTFVRGRPRKTPINPLQAAAGDILPSLPFSRENSQLSQLTQYTQFSQPIHESTHIGPAPSTLFPSDSIPSHHLKTHHSSTPPTQLQAHLKQHHLQPTYVHLSCALWAPRVHYKHGYLKSIHSELLRSQQMLCSYCGHYGATLGCLYAKCQHSYHFKCAQNILSGCFTMKEQYLCLCFEHYQAVSMSFVPYLKIPTLKFLDSISFSAAFGSHKRQGSKSPPSSPATQGSVDVLDTLLNSIGLDQRPGQSGLKNANPENTSRREGISFPQIPSALKLFHPAASTQAMYSRSAQLRHQQHPAQHSLSAQTSFASQLDWLTTPNLTTRAQIFDFWSQLSNLCYFILVLKLYTFDSPAYISSASQLQAVNVAKSQSSSNHNNYNKNFQYQGLGVFSPKIFTFSSPSTESSPNSTNSTNSPSFSTPSTSNYHSITHSSTSFFARLQQHLQVLMTDLYALYNHLMQLHSPQPTQPTQPQQSTPPPSSSSISSITYPDSVTSILGILIDPQMTYWMTLALQYKIPIYILTFFPFPLRPPPSSPPHLKSRHSVTVKSILATWFESIKVIKRNVIKLIKSHNTFFADLRRKAYSAHVSVINPIPFQHDQHRPQTQTDQPSLNSSSTSTQLALCELSPLSISSINPMPWTIANHTFTPNNNNNNNNLTHIHPGSIHRTHNHGGPNAYPLLPPSTAYTINYDRKTNSLLAAQVQRQLALPSVYNRLTYLVGNPTPAQHQRGGPGRGHIGPRTLRQSAHACNQPYSLHPINQHENSTKGMKYRSTGDTQQQFLQCRSSTQFSSNELSQISTASNSASQSNTTPSTSLTSRSTATSTNRHQTSLHTNQYFAHSDKTQFTGIFRYICAPDGNEALFQEYPFFPLLAAKFHQFATRFPTHPYLGTTYRPFAGIEDLRESSAFQRLNEQLRRDNESSMNTAQFSRHGQHIASFLESAPQMLTMQPSNTPQQNSLHQLDNRNDNMSVKETLCTPPHIPVKPAVIEEMSEDEEAYFQLGRSVTTTAPTSNIPAAVRSNANDMTDDQQLRETDHLTKPHDSPPVDDRKTFGLLTKEELEELLGDDHGLDQSAVQPENADNSTSNNLSSAISSKSMKNLVDTTIYGVIEGSNALRNAFDSPFASSSIEHHHDLPESGVFIPPLQSDPFQFMLLQLQRKYHFAHEVYSLSLLSQLNHMISERTTEYIADVNANAPENDQIPSHFDGEIGPSTSFRTKTGKKSAPNARQSLNRSARSNIQGIGEREHHRRQRRQKRGKPVTPSGNNANLGPDTPGDGDAMDPTDPFNYPPVVSHVISIWPQLQYVLTPEIINGFVAAAKAVRSGEEVQITSVSLHPVQTSSQPHFATEMNDGSGDEDNMGLNNTRNTSNSSDHDYSFDTSTSKSTTFIITPQLFKLIESLLSSANTSNFHHNASGISIGATTHNTQSGPLLPLAENNFPMINTIPYYFPQTRNYHYKPGNSGSHSTSRDSNPQFSLSNSHSRIIAKFDPLISTPLAHFIRTSKYASYIPSLLNPSLLSTTPTSSPSSRTLSPKSIYIGQNHLKQTLVQSIFIPLIYPNLFETLNIQPSKGLLIAGESGCGKSHIFTTLTTILDGICIEGGDVMNPITLETLAKSYKTVTLEAKSLFTCLSQVYCNYLMANRVKDVLLNLISGTNSFKARLIPPLASTAPAKPARKTLNLSRGVKPPNANKSDLNTQIANTPPPLPKVDQDKALRMSILAQINPNDPRQVQLFDLFVELQDKSKIPADLYQFMTIGTFSRNNEDLPIVQNTNSTENTRNHSTPTILSSILTALTPSVLSTPPQSRNGSHIAQQQQSKLLRQKTKSAAQILSSSTSTGPNLAKFDARSNIISVDDQEYQKHLGADDESDGVDEMMSFLANSIESTGSTTSLASTPADSRNGLNTAFLNENNINFASALFDREAVTKAIHDQDSICNPSTFAKNTDVQESTASLPSDAKNDQNPGQFINPNSQPTTNPSNITFKTNPLSFFFSPRVTFIVRKATDLLAKFYGESEDQIRDIFNLATICQPCIIFIDEIDAIAPTRNIDKQQQIYSSLVTTLLACMDGVDNNPTEPGQNGDNPQSIFTRVRDPEAEKGDYSKLGKVVNSSVNERQNAIPLAHSSPHQQTEPADAQQDLSHLHHVFEQYNGKKRQQLEYLARSRLSLNNAIVTTTTTPNSTNSNNTTKDNQFTTKSIFEHLHDNVQDHCDQTKTRPVAMLDFKSFLEGLAKTSAESQICWPQINPNQSNNHDNSNTNAASFSATKAPAKRKLVFRSRNQPASQPQPQPEHNLPNVPTDAIFTPFNRRVSELFASTTQISLAPTSTSPYSSRTQTTTQWTLSDCRVSRAAQIYVIATTSMPNHIDPALRRPGRFDTEVHAHLPSFPDRKLKFELMLDDFTVVDDMYQNSIAVNLAHSLRDYHQHHQQQHQQLHQPAPSKLSQLSTKNQFLDQLAHKTHGYTFADIDLVCSQTFSTSLSTAVAHLTDSINLNHSSEPTQTMASNPSYHHAIPLSSFFATIADLPRNRTKHAIHPNAKMSFGRIHFDQLLEEERPSPISTPSPPSFPAQLPTSTQLSQHLQSKFDKVQRQLSHHFPSLPSSNRPNSAFSGGISRGLASHEFKVVCFHNYSPQLHHPSPLKALVSSKVPFMSVINPSSMSISTNKSETPAQPTILTITLQHYAHFKTIYDITHLTSTLLTTTTPANSNLVIYLEPPDSFIFGASSHQNSFDHSHNPNTPSPQHYQQSTTPYTPTSGFRDNETSQVKNAGLFTFLLSSLLTQQQLYNEKVSTHQVHFEEGIAHKCTIVLSLGPILSTIATTTPQNITKLVSILPQLSSLLSDGVFTQLQKQLSDIVSSFSTANIDMR